MSPIDHILRYQKKHRLASHILFWLIVYLLGISSSRYYDGKRFSIGFSLITDGLYMSTEVIAAYFLTYLIIPAIVNRKKYLAASVAFLIGSYAICLLARFFIVRIAEPLAGVKPKPFEDNHELLTDIPKLIYVYFFEIFSVALVFLIIKLLIEHINHQQRTMTLEKEKIATELKLLKTQLNPHFLFNTLNNIYALSILNSPVTSTSIGKLAEILDYILYRCDNTLVPLSGEITLLNNYLELERLRYDQRLHLRFTSHIEQDPPIPPLLLLSLAENAFKHGASHDPGQPRIDIDLHVTPGSLRYSVSNSIVNRPPPDPRAHPSNAAIPGNTAHPGHSAINTVHPANAAINTVHPGKIGLPNIRQQLELLYPGRHTLATNNDSHQFTALLTLNLNPAS